MNVLIKNTKEILLEIYVPCFKMITTGDLKQPSNKFIHQYWKRNEKMELKESVVVKYNKKWYIGYMVGYKFHKTSEIKKLADVKDVTNYITLAKYIKNKNKNYDVKQIVSLILNKTSLSSIYILDRPINPNVKELENYWWSNINEICKKCQLSCKQSSKVTLAKCKSFKEINVNVQ